MDFLELNRNRLIRLSQERDILERLIEIAKSAPNDLLVGRSEHSESERRKADQFKRAFLSANLTFRDIPLGVKIGENRFPEGELATFSVLYDSCPNLSEEQLLPRLFGTIKIPNFSFPVIVMEDFSNGREFEIEDTNYRHEDLVSICRPHFPVEQTTFCATGDNSIRYVVGDLDGLSIQLLDPFKYNYKTFLRKIGQDRTYLEILLE